MNEERMKLVHKRVGEGATLKQIAADLGLSYNHVNSNYRMWKHRQDIRAARNNGEKRNDG